MKRSPFDILRRGFDNVLANWPLLIVRLGEAAALVVAGLTLLALAALPAIAYVGVTALPQFDSLEDVAGLAPLLLGYWGVALYAIVAASVVLMILVAVHSFVEAGMLRIYVDGERAAGAMVEAPRDLYPRYSWDRFRAGAKAGWLTIFWIYNAIWGVWGMAVLIPLLPTLAGVLLLRDEPQTALGVGCVGIAIAILVMIPATIACSLWSTKALVTSVARDSGTRDSMRIAWREVRTDFVRHFVVTLIVIVVSMAASSFVSSFGYLAALGRSGAFRLIMIPMQLIIWILSTFISGATSSWLAASYAAITPESKP
ncbi:MAG TPA: hypothetical protein VF698_10615 [Thermoanaerobaculia bacterium]